MGGRDLHPLCCISIDCSGIHAGDCSPVPPLPRSESCAAASELSVAGVLYKWTNYRKGWRPRLFSLRNGVLSYSKVRRQDDLLPGSVASSDVRVIGHASARLLDGAGGGAKQKKPAGIVHLKITSFRESQSDDRRFYVFSPTKTLHLRTDSKADCKAWIEALVLARSVHPLRTSSQKASFLLGDVSFSTEKLRDRMQIEGFNEAVINDCEQIMLSEFSEFQTQLKLRYEEHLNFLGTFQQQLEEVNVADEMGTGPDSRLQLFKHEFSNSRNGKFSEYSTTESSDDVEKQELYELSDEDEPIYFDTEDCFNDSTIPCTTMEKVSEDGNQSSRSKNYSSDVKTINVEIPVADFPSIERRRKLPEPIEKEKGVSLWSMIKDNVGKDLTRVCLPVYFNEPLSSLQKCFEDLEYSCLLDQAYEYGKMGNSLMRILKVAAFAVSGYSSSDGRLCKPFNPLLGETYEADFPEKGIRFFSEKVSHHPMLIACHCEGKHWKFWGDSNLRSKFWGRSIQLDPVGVLTLEFDDGEIFQWSKVTTTIYNLILGKVYCGHHGTMNIQGNHQYSCKLKFKEQSLLDRNPRQVQGIVLDKAQNKAASLVGKWDDSMYCTLDENLPKVSGSPPVNDPFLLWKRNDPPANPTRYNLSSFAITLNELTSDLQDKLPPTDSRLRPDQRHLENGEYEKANSEKLRLETRQRMSRKLQENGWKPRWFRKDSEDGTYRYVGGYWEAREQRNWDGCPNIFGELLDQVDDHTKRRK
ncbi:putative oxysterol-binding protein [Dioscorea sansibarensis]